MRILLVNWVFSTKKWDIHLLSARSVELAKKNSKMKAELNASFGLIQRGTDLPSTYRNPSDQELVGVSLRIPILDWGLSESEYKLAQMQKRVTDAQIQQEEIDFRELVILTVEEFNLQKQLVEGAMEADTIANAVYDITRRRYLNGQSDIFRLSTNLRASIDARRAYIQALESYWTYYYSIRSITLYDFDAGKDIEEKFGEVW